MCAQYSETSTTGGRYFCSAALIKTGAWSWQACAARSGGALGPPRISRLLLVQSFQAASSQVLPVLSAQSFNPGPSARPVESPSNANRTGRALVLAPIGQVQDISLPLRSPGQAVSLLMLSCWEMVPGRAVAAIATTTTVAQAAAAAANTRGGEPSTRRLRRIGCSIRKYEAREKARVSTSRSNCRATCVRIGMPLSTGNATTIGQCHR